MKFLSRWLANSSKYEAWQWRLRALDSWEPGIWINYRWDLSEAMWGLLTSSIAVEPFDIQMVPQISDVVCKIAMELQVVFLDVDKNTAIHSIIPTGIHWQKTFGKLLYYCKLKFSAPHNSTLPEQPWFPWWITIVMYTEQGCFALDLIQLSRLKSSVCYPLFYVPTHMMTMS